MVSSRLQPVQTRALVGACLVLVTGLLASACTEKLTD